jgi:hypothetical protein
MASLNTEEEKYWFPAKKYGWGWGPPNCWQGWMVFAIWFVFLMGGTLLIKSGPGVFVAYTVFLSVVLFLICLLKGEKPRWRWGSDQKK